MGNCPYCNGKIQIDPDGCFEEDEKHQQECRHCGKFFIYTTTIIIDHNLSRADCLNDAGQHNYQKTITFPQEFSRMRCTVCGEYAS